MSFTLSLDALIGVAASSIVVWEPWRERRLRPLQWMIKNGDPAGDRGIRRGVAVLMTITGGSEFLRLRTIRASRKRRNH